jgi:GNAT superfamily N-acetyltransferase
MQELIKRSERIERDAWTGLYRRAPRGLRQALGLRAEDRSGVTLLSATRVDHLLFNRAIGLGDTAGPKAAEEAVQYFDRQGIGRYWIHLGSQHRYSGLPRRLRTHGVVPYPRSWMKFARRTAPIDSVRCNADIRPARSTDAARIGDIVAPAFDMPRAAADVFTTTIGERGWHHFVAEMDGRVVSASALYSEGPDALLVFAATAPEARCQGCQRALMAARLEQAQRVGCAYTFTETGVPVRGERGSSYRNILRAGFDELYVRDNFAPEGTRWQNHPSSGATTRSGASAKPSRMLPKAVARSGT